ncbi:MAG TPA: hypothetical protein VLQ91_12310, partial [Draconibacterium sp.]|nr:hypothetical protein [Draconibacterium sp.]
MFFVGATGQLLTLMLTVCLPFVFLVSSQPKAELLEETLNFENRIIQQEVSAPEINSFILDLNFADKFEDIKFEAKEVFTQKMPPTEFRVKW